MTTPRILVNGSFRGQRITGQQRYATEIASRLVARQGVRERDLSERAQKSAILAWISAQAVGFGRDASERLVTLTSRGPIIGRRHVVVVHDLFVLDNPEWYSKRYIATHAPVLRAQLRTAELIVTVSDPVGDRVRALVGNGTKIVTVPNAPAEPFQPDLPDPALLTRYGLRRGGYIFAVSSQEPRKNLERLIAAHAQLPDNLRDAFPLVLAGGSSSIYAHSSDVARRAADAGVIRLGYVDDSELARLYSAAACVAFPSLDEGFGLPAVEAIASAAEVVVSDIPVLRWVCGTDAHYADPLSVASIANTLREALESPASSAERKRRARAVRQRFSWENSADTLYTAVAELTAERTPNRVVPLRSTVSLSQDIPVRSRFDRAG